MKIASTKSKESSKAAFTLLELLVVITIIGLLAGMIFTGASGAIRRAEKVNCQNTAYQLKTAISSYFTEYRKYPVKPNAKESKDLLSDDQDAIMDVLLGSDNQAKQGGLNPRKIVFFTGKAAKQGGKSSGDESQYRKGVRLSNDGGGVLVDPYNNYYRIRLDLDYNDRVATPTWDTSIDAKLLPESILIWSKGRDDDVNQTSDNVKTW